MSFNVPASFIVTFQNNMQLSLNQSQSAIWPLLRKVPVSGEKAKITDFLGHTGTITGDDRHGDTKFVNTPHDGVWIAKPPEEYWAELVDRQDQMATHIELGSGYMMAATAAINRAKDDAALAGIFGSMITGKDGTTTVPLGTGMVVPVATGATQPTRMNTAKLRQANKMLAQAYVDAGEKKYMVLTAEQSDDLLSEVPATSADFKASFGGQVDPDSGRVTRLLGWNFVPLELSNPLYKKSAALSLDTSGYRKNPFWVESGVVGGAWEELYTSLDVRPDKRNSRQVFAATIVAATRTQAGKVGYVLNSEA